MATILRKTAVSAASLAGCFGASAAGAHCADLPDYATFKAALIAARHEANGGLGLDEWGSMVDRDGIVCVVAFTGADRGAQVPGGRQSSAQKANTANDYSTPGLAVSTANLYSPTQPGGSLYGFQAANPVDPATAYAGPFERYGQKDDPLVGHRIGGTNVFGGGLALYSAKGVLLGALGASGDTSCADHNIAWRIRAALHLDYVPAGFGAEGTDNIVYDIVNGVSRSGAGHPGCGPDAVAIGTALTKTLPLARKP